MSKFTEYIGFQFGNPRGFVGKICCIIMNIINNKMYSSLIDIMDLKENANILEVGYGNGYLIRKIYKKFRPTIYGIDISEDSKKLAIKRNKNIGSDKLILDIGDCCNLKYVDDLFDVVITINTIYFWRDTKKGLSEIYRTLKEGGVFYNIVYSKEYLEKLSYTKKGFNLFEIDEFIKLGKKVGFNNVEIVEIVKKKSFVVVYKK